MLRLANGTAQFAEAFRTRHADYLRQAQQADGGFAGREGASDLYYTGFALRGLALLGELHDDVARRAGDYLRSRLRGQTPMIDFLSLIQSAMLLEATAGIDVFAAAPPGWRAAAGEMFEQFRRPDGGYAKTDEGHASSTYHTFLIVVTRQMIGQAPVEPQRLIDFARARQRDDGGFVEIGPMRKSGANPTAAAIGLLKTLESLDDDVRLAAVDFLADIQSDEGGIKANTRIPIADLLSTFTGLHTLIDLGAIDAIDLPAARHYADSLQLDRGGFRGAAWDEAADVEYTFYGLGALALCGRVDGQ
ncbi:MAG TPA: prenyltransferase/squalene oxidase repeat-containing protein [Pirellulales bacterium]|nr:prenyltransferase/squalene oxidase repeat-containing protein [Pirellulales bacterium]